MNYPQFLDDIINNVISEEFLDRDRLYYTKNRDCILDNKKFKKQQELGISDNKPTLSYTNGKLIAECIDKYGNSENIYVKRETGSDPYIPKIHKDTFEFYQVPNGEDRVCMYICAPNQSGKTTYVARYLEKYKEVYPDKDVLLFSKLSEDPILDRFNVERINISELEIDDIMEKLANALVIFDDYDQITEKHDRAKIMNLINEILCNGAHFNIDIIITNHLLSDYKNTRTILNECTTFTIFPFSGAENQKRHLLSYYFGMNSKKISELKDLNSHWVTLYKNFPQMVLYEHGIYILN